MRTGQTRMWRFILCALLAVGTLACVATGDHEVPSESECRPYIEKALKKGLEEVSGSTENDSGEVEVGNETTEQSDEDSVEDGLSIEVADEPYVGQEGAEPLAAEADDSREDSQEDDDSQADEADNDSQEDQGDDKNDDIGEADDGSQEKTDDSEEKDDDKNDDDDKSGEADDADSKEAVDDDSKEAKDDADSKEDTKEDDDSKEETQDDDSKEDAKDDDDSKEDTKDDDDSKEDTKTDDDSKEDTKEDDDSKEEAKDDDDDSKEDQKDNDDSKEDEKGQEDSNETVEKSEEASAKDDDKSEEDDKSAGDDNSDEKTDREDDSKADDDSGEDGKEDDDDDDSSEGVPEEEFLKVPDIPENLRSRDHIVKILRLDEEASEAELTIERSEDIVLRDLKKLYENAIKPLEALYKYRDLSNRHFGDPEIFSKPLVLFMGPWSGGKSSMINYLTGIEFTEWSLRTGAEPSPAYFNILMHGTDPEVLDGTQLAADWTFSGLQKFGQGLEERLRGLKYPSKLLEKVNIVEIPGILEVRKQVSRVFPFNDACQWFIDRADIIFLVYDPSKLDVGPETEAILDQLKGRESQTRILLNKADTVKPEELMRVQSALIWNISPLMSSAQPPVMYTVSLWSMPFDASAPVRLLQAQERELLKDLRSAIDRRIENKIASARRFAVRVRNHAKMVDCYLTTYYNHKTIFGNKKLIAEAIIENPQNYHIYEGLSTLTNISRYDLPDPETYRDFFRLNPIYEFQQLSATCTYFRGCPINKLDIAIAYDFPELVGKYKKMVETATPQGMPKS